VQVKKPAKILHAKILFAKNRANQFSITTSQDQSYTTLQFDYVDKGEGVVIQLIHTCTSGKDIKMRGTIKGAGKPTYRYVPASLTPRRYHMKVILFFSIPPATMVYLFLTKKFFVSDTLFLFILKVALMAWIFFGYWHLGFKTLKKRLPKGFEVFQEEF